MAHTHFSLSSSSRCWISLCGSWPWRLTLRHQMSVGPWGLGGASRCVYLWSGRGELAITCTSIGINHAPCELVLVRGVLTNPRLVNSYLINATCVGKDASFDAIFCENALPDQQSMQQLNLLVYGPLGLKKQNSVQRVSAGSNVRPGCCDVRLRWIQRIAGHCVRFPTLGSE